jgi:hypothetical protein
MSSGKASQSAGVYASVLGGSGEEDASVLSGGGGASAEPLSLEDVGVALGFDCDDEVSDVDKYRQAAAQHFASHSDDGAGGEVPNGLAFRLVLIVWCQSFWRWFKAVFGVSQARGTIVSRRGGSRRQE